VNWKRIPKEESVQPETGTYKDWKEIIADECNNSCIYCSIHENDFGGIRNFHIEHYRPKSLFKKLENDIKNLYYACSICNCFKGNDWPNEPSEDFSKIHYPDPSSVDYSDLFDRNQNGCLNGVFIASKYLLEKLYLNRPQLLLNRRKQMIKDTLIILIEKNKVLLSKIYNIDNNDLYDDVLYSQQIITDLFLLREKLAENRPYEESDLKK
jgi:hypothetical protein